MCVIQDACSKYNYYLELVTANNYDQNIDVKVIDRAIALATLKDNLAKDFSFNIIYWGSLYAQSLSPEKRVDYTLKIFKSTFVVHEGKSTEIGCACWQ